MHACTDAHIHSSWAQDYLAAVRTAVERRQQELANLEAAVCLYEQRCVSEETARRYVKRPVSLPWA